MERKLFTYPNAVTLENGEVLASVEIAYHTLGSLNAKKDNVIWICHALTASSDAMDWWDSFLKEGGAYDLSKYFIVCANIIGSCYGSSGPLTNNSATNKPYYSEFPQVTVRDMVQMHTLLRKDLGIAKIETIIGGSLGGYQTLEWVLKEPELFNNMALISTSARESAWGIAIHTAQRLAIETDKSWKDMSADAGAQGLKTARAIGLLSYRNYKAYIKTQTDPDNEKLDDYRASSYIHYQGEKLVKRFNTYSYWLLTKALDSHNVSRGRKPLEETLASIKIKTLVIGMSSDMLCPIAEQEFLAANIPNSKMVEIDSPYGHDGFLIEGEMVGEIFKEYFNL